MSTALTKHERMDLAECEEVIERAIQAFDDFGRALRDIRDRRLYREKYGTFEDYCNQRWNVKSSRARQLISAATVSDDVSSIAEPQNESQMRPLARLESAAERQDAWSYAVALAGGQPTGGQVIDAVEEIASLRRAVDQAGGAWYSSREGLHTVDLPGQPAGKRYRTEELRAALGTATVIEAEPESVTNVTLFDLPAAPPAPPSPPATPAAPALWVCPSCQREQTPPTKNPASDLTCVQCCLRLDSLKRRALNVANVSVHSHGTGFRLGKNGNPAGGAANLDELEKLVLKWETEPAQAPQSICQTCGYPSRVLLTNKCEVCYHLHRAGMPENRRTVTDGKSDAQWHLDQAMRYAETTADETQRQVYLTGIAAIAQTIENTPLSASVNQAEPERVIGRNIDHNEAYDRVQMRIKLTLQSLAPEQLLCLQVVMFPFEDGNPMEVLREAFSQAIEEMTTEELIRALGSEVAVAR